MWLIREGTVELAVSGKTYRLGPGSVGFVHSNDEHGIKNVGATLQVNAAGEFSVRVPALHRDSFGITWRGGETAGQTIPIARFYIARPDVDTAETINVLLAQSKNLISDAGGL